MSKKKVEKKVEDKCIYVVDPSMAPDVDKIEEVRRMLIGGGNYYTFMTLKELQDSGDLADELAKSADIFEVSIKRIGKIEVKVKCELTLEKE